MPHTQEAQILRRQVIALLLIERELLPSRPAGSLHTWLLKQHQHCHR
jgi:hypothetical protein